MVALIDEVYGKDFLTSSSNLFPSEFYDSHKEYMDNMSDLEIYKQFLNDEEKPKKKKLKKNNDIKENFSNIISCNSFDAHFNSCLKCQKRLRNQYGNMDIAKQKLLNSIIYILTGVFILILFDIFVRIGKYLK